MNHSHSRALVVAGLILLTACQGSQHPQLVQPAPPSIATEWMATLAQASREVREGRFAVADRLLADFSGRNVSTSEGAESMYWRALYKLDPANQGGSARDAAAFLDAYIASGQLSRRNEALTLRHVASAFESYAAAAATPQKAEAVRVDDKAKDEELARLKDELAKANAELDRIKRRLAQPKP